MIAAGLAATRSSMSPTIEVELKFQVPAPAWHKVDAAVARAASTRTRLEAAYFDTPDWRLAAAGIALRVRREGRRWVQTAKAAGADTMQRLEHNVALGGNFGAAADRLVAADPLRHAGTPVGERLVAALAPRAGEAAPQLVEHYRSVVWRRHRPLRTEGAAVELAFDRGQLVAGERSATICELEIELLRGSARAVIAVARRWVERHGVWLDVRSKSERGARLARGVARSPVVKASPVTLVGDVMTADDALRAVIANCLRQILPNASEVAAGPVAGTAAAARRATRPGGGNVQCEAQRDDGIAGHVHQLRVGLRRLRSALRFFDGWASQLDPRCVDALTQLFRQLGAARDRDALAAALLPELQAAGAPWYELPAAPPGPAPVELLRAPAATLALLDVLEFQLDAARPAGAGPDAASPAGTAEAAAASDASEPTLVDAASRRLERWHRRIVRSAQRFDALSDVERHQLRKRVKRQRYAVEFVASLYAADAVARYLALLAPLQESLGRYNDVFVARETYRAAVGEDPRAWFAIGWLTARRDAVLAESARALDRFVASERFWGGPKRRPKA